MIVNFEEITQELSDDEKAILPYLIKGFSNHSEKNPIKEPEVCKAMNSLLATRPGKVRINGARLRKMVNHIRSNGLLPLIATSNGYFVSHDRVVIGKQITSLEQRARSIQQSANGLKKFL